MTLLNNWHTYFVFSIPFPLKEVYGLNIAKNMAVVSYFTLIALSNNLFLPRDNQKDESLSVHTEYIL